jgi:hypothetical protein
MSPQLFLEFLQVRNYGSTACCSRIIYLYRRVLFAMYLKKNAIRPPVDGRARLPKRVALLGSTPASKTRVRNATEKKIHPAETMVGR